MQNLPPASQHGWRVKNGCPQPVIITKDQAPEGLLKLPFQKKSTCRQSSSVCREKRQAKQRKEVHTLQIKLVKTQGQTGSDLGPEV